VTSIAVAAAVLGTQAKQRAVTIGDLKEYLLARYGSLAASPISTGILYDLVAPMSSTSMFDGSDTCATITRSEWLQVVHELRRASLDESALPPPATLRDLGRRAARDHVHPLAFLSYRYHRIRPGVQADSVIRVDENGIFAVDDSGFAERHVFAVASLYGRTYRGAGTRFRVDMDALYFSNDERMFWGLEIDFDDGMGFREVAGDVEVHYSTTGKKTIIAKALIADGRVLSGKFTFDVVTLTAPDPHETWLLQAHLPYNGQYSAGVAYVYLANGHSTLTRPAIVSEGFDLYNDMNWDELYALLNQQNLIETLREMGYDAVVLNYDDAVTYVQRNAYLVESLIDSVNQVIAPIQTSVLVGASMGGLTTRFALAHMEATSQPHRVRSLITFDAPHRGANIPLGIQYWVDFFSEQSEEAAFLRDALNSPAARQMLIAHFTDPPSSVPSSDPLRATLLSDFAAIGEYPTLPRLVAVANGSGNRQGQGFSPGAQLIRYEYYSFLVDIIGNVWALHDAQSQQIFNGVIDLIWPLPDTRQSVTVQPTWPWDNAPGGLRNTMLQMDTTSVPYGDVMALHPNHCFIPTISSLDLAVSDPFHDIAGDPQLYTLTPFDTLYFPAVNEEHVALTPQSLWWFIEEICDSLPSVSLSAYFVDDAVRLKWSPVVGARSYHVYAADDVQVWPELYATTADTSWTDAGGLQQKRFYRVVTSTVAP